MPCYSDENESRLQSLASLTEKYNCDRCKLLSPEEMKGIKAPPTWTEVCETLYDWYRNHLILDYTANEKKGESTAASFALSEMIRCGMEITGRLFKPTVEFNIPEKYKEIK